MQSETYHGRSTPVRGRPTRTERVQRRRLALVVSLLALMVVITAAASHSCTKAIAAAADTPASAASTSTSLDPAVGLVSGTYSAKLTAAASVSAAGIPVAALTLSYDAGTRTLTYRLEVTAKLANPSIAAICLGSPGQNGSTVFTLFPGPTLAGDFSGVLAENTIAPDDLVGPLQHGTLADLMALLQSGGAYATIGTRACPIDAVRGQIG